MVMDARKRRIQNGIELTGLKATERRIDRRLRIRMREEKMLSKEIKSLKRFKKNIIKAKKKFR